MLKEMEVIQTQMQICKVSKCVKLCWCELLSTRGRKSVLSSHLLVMMATPASLLPRCHRCPGPPHHHHRAPPALILAANDLAGRLKDGALSGRFLGAVPALSAPTCRHNYAVCAKRPLWNRQSRCQRRQETRGGGGGVLFLLSSGGK